MSKYVNKILVLFGFVATCAFAQIPEGYKLVWSDEFDGDTYDTTKWESPIKYRQGASLWHPSYLTITNGVAHFDIVRNDDWGIRYVSSCLRSYKKFTEEPLFTFTYGYVETKCRLPKELNVDYWAAVWLQGVKSTDGNITDTKEALEVDIFESFLRWKEGGMCNIGFHWGGYGKNHNMINFSQNPECGPLTDTDWHVFGLLWTAEEYVFFIDGKEAFRTDLMGFSDPRNPDRAKSNGPLQNPAYIKISCEAGKWAGPNWKDFEKNAPERDSFEVDYIRVYQK